MMKRGTGDDSVRTRARHVKNASHCEGNKGSKKEERERAGRDGAAEILSLSLPRRNMSRCETAVRHLGCALRRRIRVLRRDEEDGTPSKEDERCKERGSKTLSSYGMALSAACTNFVMLMTLLYIAL